MAKFLYTVQAKSEQDAIEQLRQRLCFPARGAVDSHGLVPTPFTLTDEEREAIETAAMIYEQGLAQFDNAADGSRAIALRKLLERAR